MATITFSVSNSGGTVNLSKTLTFADADLTRLANYAKAFFLNDDGTQPTNAVAWDRLSLAMARLILAKVRRFEQETAMDGVAQVGDFT